MAAPQESDCHCHPPSRSPPACSLLPAGVDYCSKLLLWGEKGRIIAVVGWGEVKRKNEKRRRTERRENKGRCVEGGLLAPWSRDYWRHRGKKLRFYFKSRVMGEFVKDYRRCGVRQMTLVIGIISRMRIGESRAPVLAARVL